MVEWMELDRGNIDQLATCLLLDIPVACEYPSMRHAMCLQPDQSGTAGTSNTMS